jgi:glycosyltransferase involved in cell wall biosynthesis
MLGSVYRKPIVYTEHWTIFIPENPGRLARVQQMFTKLALRRSAFVLPVSDDLRAALAELEPSARFRVIRNVVDERVFHPPATREPVSTSPYRLLTIGSLDSERKGVDILLEAVARLAEERTDFHLDVIGEGRNRPAYEALAERLGVSQLVTFHGWKPKARLAELMRAADLFVLASRFENQPCVLIEAMASGLPVVATAVGGVPETVDERSGLLVEPLDPEAFAQAMAKALDGLDRYDRAGISRRALENYGQTRIGGELLEVYAEAAR